MNIRYHHLFRKHFKKRIQSTPALDKKYEERLRLFRENPANPLLQDHALTGDLVGYRAFSVTGDIRVIYRIEGNEIIFTDIGTHNQVY